MKKLKIGIAGVPGLPTVMGFRTLEDAGISALCDPNSHMKWQPMSDMNRYLPEL